MKTRVFKNKAELVTALMLGEKWDIDGTDGYCMYDESYSSPFRYVSGESNISMENAWCFCNGKTEWQQDEIKHWEPKKGEVYFSVDATDKSIYDELYCGNNYENSLFDSGLIFETREEAQKKRDYMLAETKLRKRIWELNGGEECPFVYEEDNWSVCLHDNYVIPDNYGGTKHYPNWFYCKDDSVCGQLIREMSDELKTYLGY